MTEVGSLKAIEVLLLLAGGAAVVWWQWRDVNRAQQRSREARARRQSQSGPADGQRDMETRP
jgi:hypothetical protein